MPQLSMLHNTNRKLNLRENAPKEDHHSKKNN